MGRHDDAPAWLVRLFIAAGWAWTVLPLAVLLVLLVVVA